MSEAAQTLTAIAERLHGIVYDAPRDSVPQVYIDALDERMLALSPNGTHGVNGTRG